MSELNLPFSLFRNYSEHRSEAFPSGEPSVSAFIEIFFLRQGAVRVNVAQQQFRLESGQCIMLMPNVKTAFQSIDPQRPFFVDLLRIDPDFLLKNGEESASFFGTLTTHKTSLSFVISDDHPDGEATLHDLAEVTQLMMSKPFGYAVACKAYIELILYRIVSLAELPQAHQIIHPVLQNAISYIETNYMDKISIDTLAKLCCMSKYHFIRYFYTETQQTPIEYINSFRIKTACKLLKSQKEDKIITIAMAVGFNDLSNFNRTFKRALGQTPAEYRKSMLEQEQERQTNNSIYYRQPAATVPFYSFML